MRDVDLLVAASFVYPMSEGFPILRDSEVAVVGDRIAYAGPRLPAGSWRAKRRLGGPDTAVLPGFVNCHTHTASTVFRGRTDDNSRGKGPLEYLHELGVLGPDVTIAHLTFASDADLDAAAASGAHYAHCPTMYPRRGLYPRFQAIIDRGIQTGFATDWMQNDPFEAMRYAISALRLIAGDADVMPCREALARSTIEAAGVMGLGAEIGSLEAGKKADLIIVDLDRSHLQPFYGDYAALVFYARADDVVTSVIDGRVVYEAGRLTNVDEAPIRATLRGNVTRWQLRLIELGALPGLG